MDESGFTTAFFSTCSGVRGFGVQCGLRRAPQSVCGALIRGSPVCASVLGERARNLRQAIVVENDDLGALDLDDVGFPQLTQLAAHIRPGETEVVAKLGM